MTLFASSVWGHGKAQRDFDPYLDPLKVGCLLSLVFFFFLFSRAN